MVVERYIRHYVGSRLKCNDYGFTISNNGFRGNCSEPPMKMNGLAEHRAEAVMKHSKLEVGYLETGSPILQYHEFSAPHYLKEGLKKLLLGKKSDWCVTAVEVRPGAVHLSIENPKLQMVDSQIISLDSTIEETPAMITNRELVSPIMWTLYPVDSSDGEEFLSLHFTMRRHDLGKEKDYYRIDIRETATEVEECHKISRAKRVSKLTFSNQNNQGGMPIMIGEIEERY